MFKDTGIIAYVAGADLLAARRVDVNSDNEVEYATASSAGIGVTKYAANEGESVAVSLWNKPGTFEIEAAGAVTLNTLLVAAANGKVRALPETAGDYVRIAKSLEAAAADGDIIEAVAFNPGTTETVTE